MSHHDATCASQDRAKHELTTRLRTTEADREELRVRLDASEEVLARVVSEKAAVEAHLEESTQAQRSSEGEYHAMKVRF